MTLVEWDSEVKQVEWEENGKPPAMSREEMFDKAYFNGGGKVGGYAREGYWDYPVHDLTVQHVLMRRPESVLEIGAGRGYIGKKLEDAGVRYCGVEISKHCIMTRVCDPIHQFDICNCPWPLSAEMGGVGTLGGVDSRYDLCFSIATMEHIPEEFLPHVFAEMKRTCKRGLHGIDFGAHDDGFDRTHVSLFPRAKWRQLFDQHGLQSQEIVDKEELERGAYSNDVLHGDGKLKLNLGSFTTMYHHGWHNIDIIDLAGFAQQNGYLFHRFDISKMLPYETGSVDLIMLCHVLEHFDYRQGLAVLRECRRLMKPDGCMRIIVPDAALLSNMLVEKPEDLDRFSEINDGVTTAKTALGKYWALVHAGHQAAYDMETLEQAVKEAGFVFHPRAFRQGHSQILRETLDLQAELSLYAEATPLIG